MQGIGLKLIASIPDQLDKRNIHVDPQLCIRSRHRRSTCTRCADACPTQAITWQESLEIEPAECVDCGICAAVCPTGALEADFPTNVDLLKQVKPHITEDHSISFACPRYLEETKASSASIIQVNCLGRLDESILSGAIAGGAQTVTLLDGACADCPHAEGRKIAGEVVQRANALLASFDIKDRITLDSRRLTPEANQPTAVNKTGGMSRRDLFKYLKGQAIKATAITVSSALSDEEMPAPTEIKLPSGKLPSNVPAKQLLLLLALQKLGRPVVSEWKEGIWTQFGFNEKCNGCQMCAFFCPTGALTKIEEDGKLGVAFRLAYCIDCRLCQDICVLNGVTLSPTIDLNKVVDDDVEPFLMRDAKSAPWKLSQEDRFKTFNPSIQRNSR